MRAGASVWLVAAALAGASGASWSMAGPAAADRVGPFAVGTRTETFVDATRATAPNGDAPGSSSRTLETLILYPARGKPSDADRPGAAPAGGARRFPLVIRAHGRGGSPETAEPLVRQWAAAGYVVAIPKFPLSNRDTPGGQTADFLNQPGDVSFVISNMLHLPRRDRDLGRTIDPKAVGVDGFSDGGVTTLGVAFHSCCQDSRIKAAVALSAGDIPFADGRYFTGTPVPLLLFLGTADPSYQWGVQTFADARPSKFFVTLNGAPHEPYIEPWRSVVVRAEIDFFDHYLKHQNNKLQELQRDTNVSGVASLQQELLRPAK